MCIRDSLEDVPEHVQSGMEIIPVTHMDRVLKEALSGSAASEIFGGHATDRVIEVDSSQAKTPPGPPAHGT